MKTLALGQSAVGWLTAAIGAGGLVGGAAATALVHVTRLGRTFVAAAADALVDQRLLENTLADADGGSAE